MMVMVQQVQYHPKLQHVLLCDDVDQTHQDHPHQELKRRHWWEERSERSMPVSMDRNFAPLVGALSLFRTTLEIQILQIFYQVEMQITLDIFHSMHPMNLQKPCEVGRNAMTFNVSGWRYFFRVLHGILCQFWHVSNDQKWIWNQQTLLTVCSFNPGSGHKLHPQLILSSCGGEKNKKAPGRKFQPSTKFGLTHSPVRWCPCKSCLFWHSSCQSRCFRSAALCAVVNIAWSCFSTEPVLGWRFKHQVLVRDGASSLGTINIIILICSTYGPTTSNNKF